MGCGGSKPDEATAAPVKLPVAEAPAAAPAAVDVTDGGDKPTLPVGKEPAPALATAPPAAAPPPPEPAGVTAEPSKKVTMEDFEVGKVLGKGAFGTVTLGVKKDTGEKFAIKSLNKQMLVAVKQVKGAMTEAAVLKQERHPCVVAMYYSFQDETSLHMVLDYMPGGDLYDRIEAEEKIPLDRAKLYGAEIASALGHLHDRLDIIYRDIKPENILIDEQGHAKLTDFGLVRTGSGGGGPGGLTKGKSFVGTLEYMAPEVMKQSGAEYTKAVDWWGLGVLLHEMLHGSTPFCADNHNAVQRAVLSDTAVELSPGTDAKAAALLERLLVKDPDARLGQGGTGTTDVKADPFWKPLTFDAVYAREYTPGWTPADKKPAADGDDEGEGEEADEGEEGSDDDYEDEWHMFAGNAAPPKMTDFAGFSFVRDTTFVPKDMQTRQTRQSVRRASLNSSKNPSLEAVKEEKI